MFSDKIKGKSALKARTFLNVRDKVYVCYWLSMHLSMENSAGYLQRDQIKPFIGEIFTYKKHPIYRKKVNNMDLLCNRH